MSARNIGSAIGVSVTSFTLTARRTTPAYADIASGITPFDRVLQMGDKASHLLDPATRHGAAMLDQMIDHQARIIAYNNDYRLMMLTIVPPLLLLGFMRRHTRPARQRSNDPGLSRKRIQFHPDRPAADPVGDDHAWYGRAKPQPFTQPVLD